MLDRLISRLFFRDVAGRRVFQPYGRIGAGYVVPTPSRRGIETFLRRWAIAVLAVAATQIAVQLSAVIGEAAMVFAAAYLALLVLYVIRIALFARRLKVTPLQLD